jgi:hypothetical protein
MSNPQSTSDLRRAYGRMYLLVKRGVGLLAALWLALLVMSGIEKARDSADRAD